MTQANDATTHAGAMHPVPLKVSRIFQASRETVFEAWGAAEHVKRWFAPQTYTVPHATVEMCLGGAFEVCMRSPAGEEHWTRGVFVEVAPHTRLVIEAKTTDSAGAPLFHARTEVDFADAAGGTRMEVVQTYALINPNIAAAMVAGAAEGWRTTLDKLEQEVLRLDAGRLASNRSVTHGSFHLERTYAAPIERVWKALTDPAAKQAWFGPANGRFEQIERHMDVRVGGTERLKGRWESGLVTTFDAVYHDVIANARLLYSYEMRLDERKISVSLATMQLKAEGGKTTLMVTEQGAFLDSYDDAGSREEGTGQLLNALGATLDS